MNFTCAPLLPCKLNAQFRCSCEKRNSYLKPLLAHTNTKRKFCYVLLSFTREISNKLEVTVRGWQRYSFERMFTRNEHFFQILSMFITQLRAFFITKGRRKTEKMSICFGFIGGVVQSRAHTGEGVRYPRRKGGVNWFSPDCRSTCSLPDQ